MTSSNHRRGPCVNPQCAQAVGGCAAFVIFVHDNIREYGLSADEQCSACLHAWFSHQVGTSELQGRPPLLVRGGCPAFNCGGFVLPAEGVPVDWDTACVCGGPLKAHAIISLSGSVTPCIPQLAPPQFTTTHPTRVISPTTVPAPINAVGGSATYAAHPPVEAFNALRPDEAGPTNNRRMASAERAREAIAAERSNSSRVRSSTSRTPASSSASASASASASVISSATSGKVALLGNGKSLQAALEDPNVKVFTIFIVPYQHPATEPHRGSYPHSEWVWTPEQFDKLVEQAVKYRLVLTVALECQGPVWLSLHNQVMEFCRGELITVPGYDDTITPASPTSLPFILLKSANKRKPQGAKIHSMFDDLTCTSFTVKNLLAANLIKPAYPRGEEEFAPHPMLRLAPRRGDLSASLMLRAPLWASDTPGMLDYMRTQARYDPHPCFPSRVMCVIDDEIVPGCRTDCPTEPPVPQETPVAGPSGTRQDEPSLPSPVASAFSTDGLRALPSIAPLDLANTASAPSLSALELSGMVDDINWCSTTSSSLGSPTDVWSDLPPRASNPNAASTTRARSEHPMMPDPLVVSPVGGAPVQIVGEISASVEVEHRDAPAAPGPPAPAPVVRYGSRRGRSARMTTGSRAPGERRRGGSSRGRGRASARGRGGSPAVTPPDDTHESSATPSSAPTLAEDARPGRRASSRLRAHNRVTETSDPMPRNESDVGGDDLAGQDLSTTSGGADGTPPSTTSPAPEDTDAVERPSNRRRTHSPEMPIEHNPNIRSARALRPISELAVRDWSRSIVSGVALELDFSHPIPHIRAPTLQMAADVLIFLVEWSIEKRPQADSDQAEGSFARAFASRFPHPHAECNLTTLSRLIRHASRLDLHIGEAIGGSPLRSLLRLCIQKLVDDERYWKAVGRYRCVRPGPSGLPGRERHLEMCGFFALFHMVALRVGPHPISPIALRYAIEGRDRALSFDQTFIRLMDPDLYQRLLPWAEYEWGTPLPSDPSHPLIALIFSAGVDVKVLSNPPLHAELEWMERHLVAQAVFDGTDFASDGSGLSPFSRGLHLVLPTSQTLEQTFSNHTRDYLAVMCSVRLDDVALLLRHLVFKSSLDVHAAEEQSANSEVMPNASWDVIFEEAFRDRLLAYLKGQGHPDHPQVREVVGEEVFLRDQLDPLLRARLFLQMMSGCDLVPPDGDWQLKARSSSPLHPAIYFRHVGRREPLRQGEEPPVARPINVHACFYDCTVTIDEGVRNLLREDPEGLLFEVWLHGAVLDPDDYNQV